jgi:hypothetical protein
VDRYASHLPVLKAVCGLLKPKQVLELGAGFHSTRFFLSLPLKRLVSVERDEEWFDQIFMDYPDPRLCLRRDYAGMKLNGFDLIFIDDGTSAAEREFSIRWVLEQKHPPTIVHDAEVYATLLAELATDYAVIPTMPETAVIW